jgi:carbamoyltransferase
VHQQTNPLFWNLINEYYKLTGVAMLVNTSFNVRGEPMVCTPLDAYQCFMATEMDYLVIGNFLYCKTEQTDYLNKQKWERSFKPD